MMQDALAKDAASPLVDKKNKTILRESYDVAERIVRNLGLERHKEGRRLRGKARKRSFRFAANVYDAYLKVFSKGQAGGTVDYPFYVQFYPLQTDPIKLSLYVQDSFGNKLRPPLLISTR